MKSKYKIAVVGLWHLGEIFSAGLAELGHTVIGISDDKKVVDGLNNNQPPLPEPALEALIKKNITAKRLSYTTDFSQIKNCQVVWLTFDTPVDEKDNSDLSMIFQAIKKAKPYFKKDVLLVISSQVPVGVSEKLADGLDYVYTPENLRLGEAVDCFLNPGRVIVGANNSASLGKIKEIFAPLKTEIISMSPISAEFGKHALNAFLAASICFANDLADLAENIGADMKDISRVLKSDRRIGPKAYLDAGLSFSGGTLNRDLKVLLALAKRFKIRPSVVESLYEKNEARKNLVMERLKKILKKVKGKKIAVFGLTYKPGTKTLRRSHAMEVVKNLIQQGASLRLHDPQVSKEDVADLPVKFFSDPYEAVSGAAAVVVMTPWPDFKNLQFSHLAKKTQVSAVFFDTANMFHDREDEINKAGFIYLGIGRGQWESQL